MPVSSGAEGPLYGGGDESLTGLMDPRIAALTVDRILPPDGTVVLDGGGNMGFAGRFIRVSGPRHFRLSTDFGSIGLGLGIAAGVATGRRDGPTVLWVGDGGLMMGLGDLETIGRCAIPLTVVVMNDAAFGAERFVLEDAGVANELANYAPVDLAAVANAFGIEAYTVTTNAALAERLAGLDARSAPLLLDCKIRPDIRGIDLH